MKFNKVKAPDSLDTIQPAGSIPGARQAFASESTSHANNDAPNASVPAGQHTIPPP